MDVPSPGEGDGFGVCGSAATGDLWMQTRIGWISSRIIVDRRVKEASLAIMAEPWRKGRWTVEGYIVAVVEQ